MVFFWQGFLPGEVFFLGGDIPVIEVLTFGLIDFVFVGPVDFRIIILTAAFRVGTEGVPDEFDFPWGGFRIFSPCV